MIKKFKDFLESVSFPTSEDQIAQLCKQLKIRDYSINSDLSIDIEGNVYLNNLKLKSLPLKFSRVRGYFYCYSNHLTTLEGSPREVGGHFSCSFNQLTTLKGGPREVGGNFYYSNNPVSKILDLFLDKKMVLKFWDDFDVVRNGNEVSAYRFKELYLDVTGKEFKGDLEFKGYRVVE